MNTDFCPEILCLFKPHCAPLHELLLKKCQKNLTDSNWLMLESKCFGDKVRIWSVFGLYLVHIWSVFGRLRVRLRSYSYGIPSTPALG